MAPEGYRSRAGEDAFTLLEVLIALAILSGVIVTIITVLNSHIAASTRLSETSGAVVLAREKIEEIHLYGAPEAGKSEEPGTDGYKLNYTVEDVEAGLKKVCAEVTWDKNEHVDICTYVPKKD
jgi:general secretion pathway protein I